MTGQNLGALVWSRHIFVVKAKVPSQALQKDGRSLLGKPYHKKIARRQFFEWMSLAVISGFGDMLPEYSG